MKKELRFSALIDTKEFDKTVQEMQKKLQAVYQASDRSRSQLEVKQAVSRVGLGPAPTQADKIRADQDDRRMRREMDLFIKDQVKQQEILNKSISDQLKQRKELLKAAKDTAEVDKQIATNREKMRLSEEATMRALQERQRPGFNGFGGVEGALQRGFAAYQGAGVGGAGFGGRMVAGARGFGRGVAGMGGLDLMGTGLGLVGSAGMFAANMGTAFNQAPREILAAQGSAASMYGQNATNILQGRGFEQRFFAPENSKALKRAMDEIDKQKMIDTAAIFAKIAAVGGAGYAGLKAGGLVGGAIGFSAGGIGAIPGMLAGATVGGIAGLGAGIAGTGIVGDLTGRATGTYQADMQQRQAAAYQQNLESLKSLDPIRRAMFERYQSEMMPNLQAQRAMGLSDQGLESFLKQGAGNGFLMSQTRASGEGILAAGGSTRAATGLATQANILARDMDLTNAQQLIGTLSGAMGAANATDSSLTKILSESVKLGLDKSEFVAENRKFTQMATEVIVRSGARDESGAGLVAERFRGFVAENTMAGLAGAQSAFSLKEGLSSQAGGARGVMQAASLMQNPMFKGLNPMELSAAMNMSPSEILAGNVEIEALYEKAKMQPGFKNLSYDDFKKELAKTKSESVTSPLLSTEQKKKELQAMAKGRPVSELMKDSQFRSKLGSFRTELRGVTEGFGSLSEQAKDSFALSELGLGPAPSELGATPKQSRLAEEVTKGLAQDELMLIEAVKRFGPNLQSAASATETYTTTVIEATRKLTQAIKENDEKAIKSSTQTLIDVGFINSPQTPPQTKSK